MLYFLFNSEEPVRFNQLKREMNITATTLSRRLDEFIGHDLVKERSMQRFHARVEYELSDKGRSLGPVLESLFGWVEETYS